MPKEENEGKRVCRLCIGETVLSAEIRRNGGRAECDYCGNDKMRTVTIEWLAGRADPVFRSIVGPAREGFLMVGGDPGWGPDGESPSSLMNEIIEADDDEIGRDIVDSLSNLHAWDVHDGDFDYYDDSSESYAIEDADAGPLRSRWNRFCHALKEDRRFFNDDGAALLDEILGPLIDGSWPHGGAIRIIGPDSADRFIYRARLANDEAASRPILEHRLNELSAPRPGRAGVGRMNAPGISVFYGAFDANTCVAELRVPVGGAALVGRFEIIRPLRILDLTRLEAAQRTLSYFEPQFERLRNYASFIAGFHQEIRLPVIPGNETLDYLPTQVVAEYLWTRVDPPFDGVVFGSSQISGAGDNIVLFPHAALVEGAPDEARRNVHFSFVVGPDEYDEDREPEERVLFDPLPPTPEPTRRQRPPIGPDEEWFSPWGAESEPPQPALRLADDGVSRVNVHSIEYTFETVPITFDEWEENTPF